MKYTVTTTRDTGTGPITVSAEIDFEIPRAGDTLNIYGRLITLTEDATLGVKFDYDKTTRKYTGTPLRTTDGRNELVFYVHEYSWRPSDGLARA